MSNNSIPEPAADDENYFQILISTRLASDTDVVHLSFTASKMALTKPDILGATWLSAGGEKNDDWGNPVMNLVDSTSGVTGGADFADTYDVTLDSLPKDASGDYRVLKIPYRDPSDSTLSLAGSGHLTITINSPAEMQINKTGDDSYAFALPATAADGAGGQNKWDFVELNCATPEVNGKQVCFTNTTNVDMFALGITVKGRCSSSCENIFGLNLDTPMAFSNMLDRLKALPGSYTAGIVNGTDGGFLRYLAPDLSFNKDSTELDHSITHGYNAYKAEPLSFKVGDVQYTATTDDNNVLQFTEPKEFSIAKPTTFEAILSRGPLDTGSTSDADIQGAMKFIDAAINRGILENTEYWYQPNFWYPESTAHCAECMSYNEYSDALHDNFIDRVCYGFSYDDVPGEGITSAPAIPNCTSMSLVISDV